MKVPPEEAGNYNCPLSMSGVIKVCLGKQCMAWQPTWDYHTIKKNIDPNPGEGWSSWNGWPDGPDEQTYRREVGFCGMQRRTG